MQNSLNSMVRLNQTEDQCNQQQTSNHVIKFRGQVDSILLWLNDKEQEILARPADSTLQNEPFNRILEEYTHFEKIITQVGEYSHVIMECKQEVHDITDNAEFLSEEDRDEILIGMDSVEVRYEKLKILATDKLKGLQRLVDDRQQSKIYRFEEWLNAIEMKMASANNIGPDYPAIQKQLKDMEDLNSELAQKQDFLNFMSSVIIFDDVDPESLQIQSRSCESLDRRLENLNRRWTEICNFVDIRNEKLRKADSIWRLLNIEGPQLNAWLKGIENDINETSDVANSIPPRDKDRDQTVLSTIQKIMLRSDKIDFKIKSKQSFYTSLERRVRQEIEQFDDPCSMLVIELEKQLESMQDDWNSMMRKKRMLDYAIQALENPKSVEQVGGSMIPIPDPITSASDNDMRFSSHLESADCSPTKSNSIYPDEDLLNVSSSSGGTSDRESIVRLENSLSDPRSFENSLSSEPKSLLFVNNHEQMNIFVDNDTDLPNEVPPVPLTASYATTERQQTLCHGDNAGLMTQNPSMLPKKVETIQFGENIALNHQNLPFHNHSENLAHSCRVEEWKFSLESFSNWLKETETSLNIENSLDAIIQSDNCSPRCDWTKIDPMQQLMSLIEHENQISSSRQSEFERLMLQGHQIIEDLLPEIGENEFDMEDILASIEFRFGAVKKCLNMRKLELFDADRWLKLVKSLRDACNYLIQQMEQTIPEAEIGVDLIKLAEQQDLLIHSKNDLVNNPMINACRQAANMFLDLCDYLQQLKHDSSHSYSSIDATSKQSDQEPIPDYETVWLSFKKIRKEVEDSLDNLNLHESELSQLIDDRLSCLDEVHKDMHSLQYKMQELATGLQVVEILKSNWVPLDDLPIESLSEQLEDLKIFREKMTEVESAHQVMNSIYNRMRDSRVPLGHQNSNRINELNSIWESVQTSVEERQRDIELAFDNQSASEQRFLTQTVADLPLWERRVATSKVPYFIDHENNKTKWDHPKFEAILQAMSPINDYVFAAYRTALKLRIVQKALGIDLLMLEQLKEILEATLSQELSSVKPSSTVLTARPSSDSAALGSQLTSINDPLLGVEQIILVLKNIYERIQSEERQTLDVPLSIDLTLNWLLNLYDSTRTGFISALSLRVGLALICCATREDKYTFIYEAVASSKLGSVDDRRLGTLFEICMRIPIYLGEGESFGGSEIIGQSIRNCYSMSKFNPQRPNCIDLVDYLNWLKSEPSFISWLPVLHRILISEKTVHHNTKCRLCLTKPIVGLRYRCFKCFKFNICQTCFLSGRHITEHLEPSEHLMQEYCCATSPGENVRDFTKILRNKFSPRPLTRQAKS